MYSRVPLNVLLVGRMAGLMKSLIESRLDCDYELRHIADLPSLEASPAIRDEADVIVGWPLSAGVARAKKVRLIQACGAGIDGLPVELLRRDTIVTNTFHHEVAIAEHVLMAMLFLSRRPVEYDQRLRAGDWWDSCIWGQAPNLQVLDGRIALVIGTGHIAREVARRARSFGVKVVAVSRKPPESPGEFDLIVGYDNWREQLKEADFVIPCCPLTAETEGLIGSQEIALMKLSAFVINTARGKIVDESALYEALRDRRIGGAAIDVWYAISNRTCRANASIEIPVPRTQQCPDDAARFSMDTSNDRGACARYRCEYQSIRPGRAVTQRGVLGGLRLVLLRIRYLHRGKHKFHAAAIHPTFRNG